MGDSMSDAMRSVEEYGYPDKAKREGVERLDRVQRDGYWYVLVCGCRVGWIDGQFLHRPPSDDR